MTDLSEARALASLLVANPKTSEPPRLLQGIIADLDRYASGPLKGTATVYISGGAEFPVGNVRVFNHYKPIIGDTVWLVKNGPDLMVLGKLTPKASEPEAWRIIGAVGQPAFMNNWAFFGGSHATPGFYKDPSGVVRLKGMITTAPGGAEIFTLPVGYRPLSTEYFSVITADVIGIISITTSGVVALNQGNNSWVSLDGVQFLAQTNRDHRESEMEYGDMIGAWVISVGMGDGLWPAIWSRADGLKMMHRGGMNGGATPGDVWRMPDAGRCRDGYLFAVYGWNGATTLTRVDVEGTSSSLRVVTGANDIRCSGVRWFADGFDTKDWIAVAVFSNAWVNYEAVGRWRGASYYKDAYGVVHLHGMIKNGAFNTTAFTLPVGYRPGGRFLFPAHDSGGLCRLEVQTDGRVMPITAGGGTNAFVSLDNISFRADG